MSFILTIVVSSHADGLIYLSEICGVNMLKQFINFAIINSTGESECHVELEGLSNIPNFKCIGIKYGHTVSTNCKNK